MPEPHHLKRRGAGRWWFQIAIPKALQEKFDGRRVVQIALRTSDIRLARAKRDELLGEWKARFRRMGQSGPPKGDELAAERRTAFRQALNRWRSTYTGQGREAVADALGMILEAEHVEVDGEALPAPGDHYRQRARQAIERMGAEATEEAVEALAETLLDANVEAAEAVLKGYSPPVDLAPRPRRSQIAGTSISEAARLYIEDRTRDPRAGLTAQTVVQMKSTFRLFSDYMHDDALGAVRRQDVAEFLDTIGKLNPLYGRSASAKELSLAELLDRYPGPPHLSSRTLNRHASTLIGLFDWASRRGMFEGENPASGHHRKEGDGWRPFTVDELNALFSGPLFDVPRVGRVKPQKHDARTALRWVVPIALFSGLRLDEICGLRVEDVRREDGVLFFDVKPHDGRRVKTKAAVRRVPVHSALVKIGFADYLKHVAKEEFLFPGLKPGGPDAKRSWYCGKRFTEYRRAVGIDAPDVVFHSLRKNVVEALERARLHQSEVAQLVGHHRGFTFSVYSPHGLDLKGLRAVVEKISYPKLKLA